MFSGLTNQVTSWMGAVKGEQGDEDVAQATGETSDIRTQPDENVGAEQAQAAFENVPVGGGDGTEEDGGKATRYVFVYYSIALYFSFLFALNILCPPLA